MSRVLVVDDDSGNRLILRSRLTDRGHEVALAESGARGLVLAHEQRFDAFVVSVRLSAGIDGLEVCRRLRSMPETNGVPVILFADSLSGESQLRGHEAGAEAVLLGGELPTLEPVLDHLLRQARVRRELEAQLRALQEQARRAGPREHEPAREVDGHGAPRDGAALRPDGILIVDSEGTVRHADRGAAEQLGSRIEGSHLGHLAPAAGLEAFVRDAHIEPREGFRFDLVPRRGRAPRSLSATVVPMVVHPGDRDPSLKVLMLFDAAKRRLAHETARAAEPRLLRQELGALIEAARETFRAQALLGECEAMRRVRARVVEACQRSEPVLVTGERGTGKERVARTLHYGGSSTGAFVPLRCSALSPENLEVELFGVAKGAAGATVDRPGLFHLAQDGTLYLEEVGELPLEIQRRLLAFLESGVITRHGSVPGRRPERLDVRIVASSIRPLAGPVEEGRFLPELRARLEAIVIDLPPLAARLDDVPALARHAVECYGALRQVREVGDEVIEVLRRHRWTGNVSELFDCLEQACARARDGRIEVADLPRSFHELGEGLPERSLTPQRRPSAPVEGTHLVAEASEVELRPREARPWDISDDDPISLDVYEKKVLLRALNETKQNRVEAARLLGVGKSTLYRKLKRFGIE